MTSHRNTKNLTQALTFDSWRYWPESGLLKKGQVQHRLAPQPNLVLNMLLTEAPKPVTRQQFLEAVWTDKFVNEDALSRTVAELRKLLGDSASQAKYIKTIPKKGYQFVAEVESIKTKKSHNRRLILATAVFILILSIVIGLNQQNQTFNQLQNAVANAQRVTFQPGMEKQSVVSEEGDQILYVETGDTMIKSSSNL